MSQRVPNSRETAVSGTCITCVIQTFLDEMESCPNMDQETIHVLAPINLHPVKPTSQLSSSQNNINQHSYRLFKGWQANGSINSNYFNLIDFSPALDKNINRIPLGAEHHVESYLLIFLRELLTHLTADSHGITFFNLQPRFYPNPGEVAPKETSAASSTCVWLRTDQMVLRHSTSLICYPPMTLTASS